MKRERLPYRSRGATRPPMERMLRIHQAIQRGGHPSAARLARDLEVSTKSVYRDIEFMRDRLGLPVEYDERRYGYYYAEEVGSFPTLQITEGELLALLVAEKALQQYRGTSFEKPLVSAFKKMAATLPDTVSIQWADWDQTISFRTSAEPVLNLEVFEALTRATAERRQIRLGYRKPGQSRAESRIVDPYHLANINGEWFLFGYCHLRHDIRTFVPARIQSVEQTGSRFARPEQFSLEKRLRDSFGVQTGPGDFAVRIQFADAVADYVREKRWHPSQKLVELPDGKIELRMRLSNLVEVQRWILSWGGKAWPVEPPQLIEGLRQAAGDLLNVLEPAQAICKSRTSG